MAEADGPFSRFKTLIATDALPALGQQRRPGTASEAELDRKLADFFATERVPTVAQPLLRGAAFLWHDHLDASHNISQGIETRDGSWLHGIMHRREPDYSNSKYWFRRVGKHSCFAELSARIGEQYDPLAFVDRCDRRDSKSEPRLREIQALELQLLAEHLL